MGSWVTLAQKFPSTLVQTVILGFKSSPGGRDGNREQRSCLEGVLPNQRSEAPALAAGPGTRPLLSLKTQLYGLKAQIQDDPSSSYSK